MGKWFLSKIINDKIVWLNYEDKWVKDRQGARPFSSHVARNKKKELGKKVKIYNGDLEIRGSYLQEVIFENEDLTNCKYGPKIYDWEKI